VEANNRSKYARQDGNTSQIQPENCDADATIVSNIVNRSDSGPNDAELAEVIAAWPALSESDRSSVLGRIRSARP
jgi:hypothetical protein